MKHINQYIKATLIAMLAVLTVGCSDFLNKEPLGAVTEDNAPGGAIETQVYGMYGMMRSYNITAGIPAFLVHMVRSEDSEKGSDAGDGADQAAFFDNFEYHADNGSVGAYWSHNYKIIGEANSVIDTLVNKIKIENLDEGRIINLGEAHFFRAYCFFNMVRAFGEVPKIDFKVNKVEENNIPKSSVQEIYELIDADLKLAAQYLPEAWPAEQKGRLVRTAALALHARTYMMRNDWSNMLKYSEDVIGSGLYNLNTPYNKIFMDEGEFSSESVFELGCMATSARPADLSIGSQFCEVQGVRGGGEWDLGWGWHMATTELGKAFEEGDPRKNATLLYFRKSVNDPITPENTNEPWGESPVSSAMGAYYNKKAYTDPAKRKMYTRKGFWVNIRLIRYADVVLMAAEASNEMGNTTAALRYLEQVRSRARGTNPDILPEVTTTDQAELRKAIQHERRVELALEPDRFYDLVRWGTATEVLHAAGKTNYQDKHRYLPIPQSEIDKSGGVLVQNPDFGG